MHVYSHLNLSTSLQGCVFAVRTQSSSSIAPSVLSAIGAVCQAPGCDVNGSIYTTAYAAYRCAAEQHDGQALPPNAPLTLATHVVLQHQRQPEYTEAVQQQKIIVNSYWLLACVEAKRMLPIDDLVGQWLPHISCSSFVHAAQAFDMCTVPKHLSVFAAALAVFGLQNTRRIRYGHCAGHLHLWVFGCVCSCEEAQTPSAGCCSVWGLCHILSRAAEMRLNAVSHIIARDVDDKSSKKLEHARK